MSSPHLEQRVRRVLEELAVPAFELAPLIEWLETVVLWNKRLDLTAARDDDELVDLMVADAACLARLVGPGARVVDVGSGAGAPGLALALLRGDLALTLVEPLQKRAAFLRTMKGRVAPAITVMQGKGERLEGTWEVALSRATLSPPRWIELGARLAPEVWLFLARDEPPALAGWDLTHDERYRWPLTGAERRLVRFERAGRELANPAMS